MVHFKIVYINTNTRKVALVTTSAHGDVAALAPVDGPCMAIRFNFDNGEVSIYTLRKQMVADEVYNEVGR